MNKYAFHVDSTHMTFLWQAKVDKHHHLNDHHKGDQIQTRTSNSIETCKSIIKEIKKSKIYIRLRKCSCVWIYFLLRLSTLEIQTLLEKHL